MLQSLRCHKKSLVIAQNEDDDAGLAREHDCVGCVEGLMGQHAKAIESFKKELVVCIICLVFAPLGFYQPAWQGNESCKPGLSVCLFHVVSSRCRSDGPVFKVVESFKKGLAVCLVNIVFLVTNLMGQHAKMWRFSPRMH